MTKSPVPAPQSWNRVQHAPPLPITARYRDLVWELTKREIFGRYRGANLGMFWSLLSPFLMLGVYMLALGGVLRARWPGVESSMDFGLILFVGLVLHAFFAECLTRAPVLVTGNANYVKRIVFPLEILPWPTLLSGLFHLALNLLVLAGAIWLLRGEFNVALLLVPLVLIPLVFWGLGFMWMLGSLGVYLRDIAQVMPPVASVLLFLSSAIVPLDAIPPGHRWLFELNPLTPVIDAVRSLALHGVQPDWMLLAQWGAVALAWALLGYGVFCKLRKGFADVL